MDGGVSIGLIDYGWLFEDGINQLSRLVPRPLAATLVVGCAMLWWLLLMRLISSTAQKFVRTLRTLSDWLGLQPRLAGAMLLPLGNGAPNLFSALAAMRFGKANLAVGRGARPCPVMQFKTEIHTVDPKFAS